jgi:hypothetical protein
MLRVDIGQPAAKSGLFRLYKHIARFPIGFNVVAAPSYQSTNALSSGEEVLCVCDTEILMNPCVRLHILTLVPTRGGAAAAACILKAGGIEEVATPPIGQLQKETPRYQAEEMELPNGNWLEG